MSGRSSIGALILAAGSGTRIGTPKLALTINGIDFLTLIRSKLRAAGIDRMSVIVSEEYFQWAQDRCLEDTIIVNTHPERGMYSSVLLGRNSFSDCSGVLINPVDYPAIQETTYSKLIELARSNPKQMIKPVYQGRSGHPIIIPTPIFQTLLLDAGRLDLALRNSRVDTLPIEVNDPGILLNINDRDTLDRLTSSMI